MTNSQKETLLKIERQIIMINEEERNEQNTWKKYQLRKDSKEANLFYNTMKKEYNNKQQTEKGNK